MDKLTVMQLIAGQASQSQNAAVSILPRPQATNQTQATPPTVSTDLALYNYICDLSRENPSYAFLNLLRFNCC